MPSVIAIHLKKLLVTNSWTYINFRIRPAHYVICLNPQCSWNFCRTAVGILKYKLGHKLLEVEGKLHCKNRTFFLWLRMQSCLL
jgi:hypothetical protein